MSAACQSLPRLTCEQPVVHPVVVTSGTERRRHPIGFGVIYAAVFCERWAACMLGASMVLMLCERYGYSRGDALRMAGLFNAASYLATLPGGFAVDRAIGPRRAVGAGMALLALGYTALTFAEATALWLALPLLLLGHALFKPSTQAVLGRLHAPNGTRLDAVQIAFYLAVNAGVAVGAVAAGLLLRGHDFHSLCAAAAAVMLVGWLVLALGRDTLRLRDKGQQVLASDVAASGALDGWKRARVIGTLTLAMMVYTVGVGQVEGSLFLWAQDRTDRVLLDFEIPAAWYTSGTLGYWLAGEIGAL